MAISRVWKIARRSPGLRLLNPSDESEVRRAGKYLNGNGVTVRGAATVGLWAKKEQGPPCS
jgi:hypothetical protein